MKKITWCLMFFLLPFVLAGCAGAGAQAPTIPSDEILIGLDRVPKEVASWIEEHHKSERGVFKKSVGTWDAYLIAMGEQRTGGYLVKIDNAGFDMGKTWIVDVVFEEPEPGQIVTMALTYPFEVFAVRQGTPVKVRLLSKTGEPSEMTVQSE
ncbi:MAG: protease complex subunit PrcB family protein [Bacillota bacterium]